jgi:hypothetical protein
MDREIDWAKCLEIKRADGSTERRSRRGLIAGMNVVLIEEFSFSLFAIYFIGRYGKYLRKQAEFVGDTNALDLNEVQI